jgi:hypothetical protein
MGIGKEPPSDVHMPNENAKKDSSESKQYPTESTSQMSAKYSVQKLGMTPQADVCVENVGSTRSIGPLTTLHASKDGARVYTKNDWIQHAFHGPELHDAASDDSHHHGTQEEVDTHVEEILREVVKSRHSEPGEGQRLIRACKVDSVRQGLFKWLRADNKRSHRHNAAIKILGACSGVVVNERLKVESDLLDLAVGDDVPELVRDQSMLALADLKCPSTETLNSVRDPDLCLLSENCYALPTLHLHQQPYIYRCMPSQRCSPIRLLARLRSSPLVLSYETVAFVVTTGAVSIWNTTSIPSSK